MSKKKKVTILSDNKTSIPIPVNGPHDKISNNKFRHFWAYAVSPKEGNNICTNSNTTTNKYIIDNRNNNKIVYITIDSLFSITYRS
jgi:hypothetical protein